MSASHDSCDPGVEGSIRAPDFALGSHTASLGLVLNRGTSFPERYRWRVQASG
jgi:glucose/arabinose dehydrogenase